MGGKSSTSFNIRDNKEMRLKTHLNSLNIDSTSIQHGFKGVANGFDIALQQNRMDVEVNVEAVCSGL